jgi:tetratricopeptide (TPR) repeat protein
MKVLRATLPIAALILLEPTVVYPSVPGAATQEDQAPATSELYEQGVRAYAAGHFDEAIELFKKAYNLSKAPALLFNIAQSYRKKGPKYCSEAGSYYEEALLRDPKAPNGIEIRDRILEMRTCAAAEAAKTTPPSPANQEEPPVRSAPPRPGFLAPSIDSTPVAPPAWASPPTAARDRPGRGLGPWLTGAGAALTIAGGVLYWRSSAAFDDAQKQCPCPRGTYDGWDAATTASYILIGAGVAAVTTGIIAWILHHRHDAIRDAASAPLGVGTF